MKKAANIPKVKGTFWRLTGELVSNMIRDRVRKKSTNYLGAKFQSYETSYSTKKAARKAGRKGQSISSTSTSPDMTLTGKTMDDLQVRSADKDGVTYGWLGIFADVITNLYERKNYQVIGLSGNKVLHTDEENFITKRLEKQYDKNIKEYESEDVIIKLDLRL